MNAQILQAVGRIDSLFGKHPTGDIYAVLSDIAREILRSEEHKNPAGVAILAVIEHVLRGVRPDGFGRSEKPGEDTDRFLVFIETLAYTGMPDGTLNIRGSFTVRGRYSSMFMTNGPTP